MRYQIRDETCGLAFYEADSQEEALVTFLWDMLHGMAKVFDGPGVLHPENGKPACLNFGGEKFHAIPTRR